jgi:hypothetical protein
MEVMLKRKSIFSVSHARLPLGSPLFFLFFSLFVLFNFSAFRLSAQCSPRKIVKNYKPNLKPYKYDSYAYNDITFTDKPQMVEVEFAAFAGMKYKLVLGTSMFDENVKVNIYDHSHLVHRRKKLYDNSSGVDNLFWSVEIDKPGTYYIDYDIPVKGDSKSVNGCMVILIGFIEN